MKVFVSDLADADLAEIYQYIAERSPAGADSFVREIARRFENLGMFPFIGRERSMLFRGMRSVVVHPYVVFYTVEPDGIVIMRVLHGRRDIDLEFQR